MSNERRTLAAERRDLADAVMEFEARYPHFLDCFFRSQNHLI